MKTTKFINRATSLFAAACMMGSLTAGPLASAATVLEDFSSGTLAGGTGWDPAQGGWNVRTFRGPTTTEVINANPFGSGGNYLQVAYTQNIVNDGSHSIVRRKFDTTVINVAAQHMIKFDYRLDFATHWNKIDEKVAIYAGPTSPDLAGSYANLSNTWGLLYDGVNGWRVIAGNGAGGVVYVAPEVLLRSNADGSTIYSVAVDVRPETHTFTISISDGTHAETWGGQEFSFINPNADAGNYLSFYTEARNGVTIKYSLDNVEVIPEASSVALVLVGLGGLAIVHRGRSLQLN